MKKLLLILSLSLLLTACKSTPVEHEEVGDEDTVGGTVVSYDLITEADTLSNEDLVYVKDVVGDSEETTRSVLVQPVKWLSETDGTCQNQLTDGGSLPTCNPNGFLIDDSNTESYSYIVPLDGTFYILTPDNQLEARSMTFAEFQDYYLANREMFASTPFHLQINPEWQDYAFGSLVQKYIP